MNFVVWTVAVSFYWLLQALFTLFIYVLTSSCLFGFSSNTKTNKSHFLLIFNFLHPLPTPPPQIAETFSTGFSMTCNIDQVLPATNAAGVAQADRTEVRAHFIRDDVPVPATEIEVYATFRLRSLALFSAMTCFTTLLYLRLTNDRP